MKVKFKIIPIIFAMMLFMSTANVGSQVETNSKTVSLGGEAFGIKMFSDGVLVVKTQDVITNGKNFSPSNEAGIKENDIITHALGQKLRNNEQLKNIIENSNGESIEIKYIRDKKSNSTTITPVKDQGGTYRAGLWIKDSAAGIGTVSFYSKELGGFCGLGHGICDSDTGTIMPIATGDVDRAYITSVTKSSNGNVGCLNGYFTDVDIGDATINNRMGIYGNIENIPAGTAIEIADKDEVKTGKAYIYTTIKGDTPEKFEARIIKTTKNDTKDMVLIITDEKLLNETGGIVQGMSGSPIIQNNKLIGAITHVVVDDVACGYGIYAQRMYENLVNACS